MQAREVFVKAGNLFSKYFFSGKKYKALSCFFFLAFILSLYLALSLALSTVVYYDYTLTLSYKMTKVNSLVPQNMPVFAEFVLLHPVLFSSLVCIIMAQVSVIFFGLWRGKIWAVKSASYFCYIFAAVALILLIFPNLIVPKVITYKGAIPYPEFNAAVKKITFIFRLVSALFTFLFMHAALFLEKLSSKENFYK